MDWSPEVLGDLEQKKELPPIELDEFKSLCAKLFELRKQKEEIETKLTNTTLRAVSALLQIESLTQTGTTMDVAIDEENNPDHAELQMGFDVTYMTTEGTAATIL